MPDQSRLTLILGGARSGKSTHAERLVSAHPAPWVFLATAEAHDTEMRERIAIHQARRGEGWSTVNAPLQLADALAGIEEGRPVLVDCLTLWLSNHMLAGNDVDGECSALIERLRTPRGAWVVVSNEVGLGIVPESPLGRRFRDAQGRLNQMVAAVADEVLLMVAGIPMKVKP